MTPKTFNRLHTLRHENDAAGYAMEEMRPRFDRMANRHENGTAPRAVSAYQLFQTPPELAARLVSLLELPDNARILEPSAGLGRLLDAIEPYYPREVIAVESAPACAAELYKQDRKNTVIRQRDFLTETPDALGLFEFVVMNPPFHMRADIHHILHALTFLRPGGRLAAICFNTSHRREKLRPLAAQWIEIECGEFGKEGTNVPTVLLTINK